jgi:CheY-like chemotaxis protein
MAAVDKKPPSGSWQQHAETFSTLTRAVAYIVILLFVAWHWAYFSAWLNNTTHIELGSLFKADHYVEARHQIEEYSKTDEAHKSAFNPEFAQAAVSVATRVSPALRGAMVLWVDPNVENNKVLVDILSSLGIAVVRAYSTNEALQRLSRDHYSLVISSVHRGSETGGPLNLCPVHYFDFPDDKLREQFNGDLAAFNRSNNVSSQAGFNMLEEMRHNPTSIDTPVIFFTNEAAGKVGTQCSTLVTNRFDVLLQQVVSTLALERWNTLTTNSQEAGTTP